MTAVLSLRNVSVRYGSKEVLHDVSLELKRGETLVLVGASGAGKSTLLGVINGTVVPTTGHVSILGQELGGLSGRERRRLCSRVGTVYQDLCLVNSLRVVHNVNAGNLGRWNTLRALRSLVWPADCARVQQVLELLGIEEKMYERTGVLSGGQQQRVAIARVLIQDPDLILADEPISSLDPERSRATMDLLCGLSRERGKSLVASCHSVEFARTHFDRVVGLRDGRIRFDCTPATLSDELLAELYLLPHDHLTALRSTKTPNGQHPATA